MERHIGSAGLLLALAALAGCSSQTGGQLPTSGDAMGTIRLIIHWPAAGAVAEADGIGLSVRGAQVSARVIPPRTCAVVVTVTASGQIEALSLSRGPCRRPVDGEPDGAVRRGGSQLLAGLSGASGEYDQECR